jgi:hypothetical protein
MRFLTNEEAMTWFGRAEIRFDPEARCLTQPFGSYCFNLPLPTPVYRVSNLVNLFVPYNEQQLIPETILWFETWGVWNEVHERAGMYILRQMRAANGEGAPLIDKPGILFDSSESVALQSFLILPVLFSWDSYMAPGTGEYFVFTSHDEYLCVVSRTSSTHAKLMHDLQDWEPRESEWIAPHRP